MLYNLLTAFNGDIALFKYITFRSAMAALTTLLFTFIFGRPLINLIKKLNLKEKIREDGPKSHKAKEGTPTMGGIIIILSILAGVLLWTDVTNPFIQIMLFATFSFGILGFTDDLIKRTNKKGVLPVYKIIFQLVISIIISFFVLKSKLYSGFETMTNLIFLKNIMLNLSYFYIPFVIAVILGSTNGANLADGLDGLASGMLAVVFAIFAIIIYITGNRVFADYLNILYIDKIGELTIFVLCTATASLGFLWFNAYPAEIFMGDTGAITLGGILGTAAVLSKQEVLLFVAGGMFVFETLSVMLQVSYFKISKGKRILKMAPLHHHFEQMGIPESKIVIRFWIVAILFGILALSTLKVR